MISRLMQIYFIPRDFLLYRKVHYLFLRGKQTPIKISTIPDIMMYKGGLVNSSLKNSLQNTSSEE